MTTFGIIITGKMTLGYLDLCGARSMLTSLPINSTAVPTVTHSLKIVASFWNAIIKMFLNFCILNKKIPFDFSSYFLTQNDCFLALKNCQKII
jgi:hypothetical protein